jgi:hypothetical protein
MLAVWPTSFQDICGLKTWWAYFKKIPKGHKLKKTMGNIYQRGDDMLNRSGWYCTVTPRGCGPTDRPSVDTIFLDSQG